MSFASQLVFSWLLHLSEGISIKNDLAGGYFLGDAASLRREMSRRITNTQPCAHPLAARFTKPLGTARRCSVLWPNLTLLNNVAFALPNTPKSQRLQSARDSLAACHVVELASRKHADQKAVPTNASAAHTAKGSVKRFMRMESVNVFRAFGERERNIRERLTVERDRRA